ncbi:MAG: hypothetical protein QFC55_06875 [Chloroflexota bacterium]|nr:hypothetical protein [Chloroflexota bacterium]
MGKLVDKATGARVVVDDAEMPAALASGKYVDPGVVAVHRFGEDTYTTPDVAKNEGGFAPRVTGADVASAQGHQIRSSENTGIIASGKAFVGAGLGAASFGMVDPFQDAQ